MGLPSYIVNFDEIKKPIMDAITEAQIQVNVGDVALDSEAINIDLTPIEDILKDLLGGSDVVKEVDTMILDSLNLVYDLMQELKIQSSTTHATLLAKLQQLLEESEKILDIVKKISESLLASGDNKIQGKMIDAKVNSIFDSKRFITDFVFIEDGVVYGITTSQSAWNDNDFWEMQHIAGSKTVDLVKSYSKMRGEHKRFERPRPVSKGDTIRFIYNNESMSSKKVWVDLFWVEMTKK